ncbi:ABC transporter permease [Shewanella sp. C32]|uniref:ABC transporter permease n=1 Tax=Shewanella electrica TaxID=515560 RepID=A0ABT2FLL4_9GAMM|nr:ABC transporter permease [Shewanella electrica]MCH1925881.1 ABC transporter permease [Shewanella electrica]MCS4557234.1 ABC transporter permease [Shewanella electrica]
MSKTLTLLRKELIDASRDKRSVLAGLYYAIGTPLIMCGLFMVLINQLSSPDDLPIKITNADTAPDLVRYLGQKGINNDTGEQAEKIQLIISDDYAKQMAQGKSAEVIIVADNSEEQLQKSIRRLQLALQNYSMEMGSLRLLARGIDPRVLRPLQVELHDQATQDSKGGMIMGIAIFTMLYSVFISGMNLAIDTSAGERERNSLGLLLSHPVTTGQLVLSKLLAVTAFAMLGLVLILAISHFAYPMVPWPELGFSITITPSFMATVLVIGLPVAMLAASLQLFVSFMAKTFKEAQSYLTMVMFIPLALAMSASYNIAPDVLKWLPVSGQQGALMEVIKGKALPLQELLISSGATLAITLLLALALTRMLRSEKVVFGL